MQRSLVVAVVLAFGAEPELTACIESLSRQAGVDLQIVVVQNGAGGEFLDALGSAFPALTILRNGANIGAAGGRNIGIQWALDHDAGYVFLVDNDAVIAPDACLRLVEAIASDPEIGFAGCVVWQKSDPGQVFSAGAFLAPPLSARHVYSVAKDHPVQIVDFAASCAFLVPISTIRSIGLMDESLFVYDEDLDWCLKGKAVGLATAVSATAAAYHDIPPGKNKSPLRVYYGIRNRLVVFARHRILPSGARGKWAVARALLSDLWRRELWGKGELRMSCAFAYALGVAHAVLGRMGSAPAFLQKPNAAFAESRFRLWFEGTSLWKTGRRLKRTILRA